MRLVQSSAEVVGRQGEWSVLSAFLDAASESFAAAVLRGPAGIGKTTLWRAAISAAEERGMLCLTARPVETEAEISFAVLGDLLAGVSDEAVEELPEPQQDALEVALLRRAATGRPPDRRALGVAVLSLLRALSAASPILVAVDDGQWVDRASRDVLAYVTRRLDSESVGVLVTTREDADVPLVQAVPAERRTLVPVEPLSVGALHRLISARSTFPIARPVLLRLHELSGGNPLFALELLRALEQSGRPAAGAPFPVPETLPALLEERLAALPAVAEETTLAASMLRAPAVADLTRAGAGDGLATAQRSGVLTVEDDGRVWFTHPLLRAAAYSRAPAAARLAWHARLAAVVPDPEERARHLALSAPAAEESVARAIADGATAAAVRGAPAAAAELLALAARLTPADDADARSDRLRRAGSYLFAAGDAAGARALVEEACATAQPGPRRAEAMLLLATVTFYAGGSSRDAVELCLGALSESGLDDLLEAAIRLRAVFMCDYDHDLALEQVERAMRAVERAGPTAPADVAACAVMERAYARFFAGLGLGTEEVERGRRLLASSEPSDAAVRARGILCNWTKYTDRLEEARALNEEDLRRAVESGDEQTIPVTLGHLAEIEVWLGEWQQARRHARECIESARQTGQPSWGERVGLYVTALVDAHFGDLTAAREAAMRGLSLAEMRGDAWMAAAYLSVLGFAALSSDDPLEARRQLDRAQEMVEAMGMREPARYRFHGDHVEALVAVGALDEAAHVLAALDERMRVAPRPWLEAIAGRGHARLLAARGDVEGAAAATAVALEVHERLPMPFERARTLLVRGATLRRLKAKREARAALEDAFRILQGLGATVWAARCAAELRRVAAPGSSSLLTSTEERVAYLVAQGLTNPEIAATAYMSRKTVEANLTRIYRKLGVRSRTELATRLATSERESDTAG